MADKLYDFLFPPDLEAQSIESVTIPDVPQRDELSDFLGIRPMRPDEIEAHTQPSEPIQPIVQGQVSDTEPIQPTQLTYAQELGAIQQPISTGINEMFTPEEPQEHQKVQPIKALAEGTKQTAKAFGGMFKGIGDVISKRYSEAIEIEKSNLLPGESSEYLEQLKQDYEFTKSTGEIGKKILKAKILEPNEDFKKASGLAGYLQDVIMVAPQIAGTVAATTLGGPGAGIAFTGTQIAGSKYQQLTEEGIEPDRAFLASVSDAALQAPLEQIGVGKALKVFKPGKIAGKAIKEIVEAGATEFFTEAVQKYPEAVTEIWAKTEGKTNQERAELFFDNFWEITKEGIKEGLVAAPFGVGISGAGVGLKTIAEKAEQQVQPEAQIEPSETVQEKPIEKLPDVTEQVLVPIEPTPEEKQLAERVQKEQAEQVKEKKEPEPVISPVEEVVLEEEKPVPEPVEIEPKKTVKEKVDETLVEKGLLEKKKPIEEKKEIKIAKVEGQEVDVAPTEAQKEAGNYKKAHITRDGMEISIENPAGSVRSGVDKSGKKWSQEMKLDYGYIKGTKGKDKDHVDVFIKPGSKEGGKVFVINQIDPKTKKFDEHKGIIGVETEQQALDAYNSNYEKGWKGAGDIVEMTMDEFKTWVRSDDPSKGPAKVLKVPVEKKEDTKTILIKVLNSFKKGSSRRLVKDAIEKGELKPTEEIIEVSSSIKKIGKGVDETVAITETVQYAIDAQEQNKTIKQYLKDYIAEEKKIPRDLPKHLKETYEDRSVEDRMAVVLESLGEDGPTKKDVIKEELILKHPIKINDGTKEIEIDRGSKVTYGKKEGTVVGYRNIKDKYFSRFKDDKTGKVELVPLSKPLKPIGKVEVQPSKAIPDEKSLELEAKKYKSVEEFVKKIPSKKEIVSIIKKHPLMSFKGAVKNAYIVGTGATGKLRPDSDIDILFEVSPQKNMSDMELSEYHRRKIANYFMKNKISSDDKLHPQWDNRRVDLYFTYDAKKPSWRGDTAKLLLPESIEQLTGIWEKAHKKEIKPSEAISEKQVDGITETDIKEIGTKPNNLEAIPEKKKEEITKKPRIKPSEGLLSSPSDEKGKTSEQLRTSDVVATARKTRAKTATTKNKQIKAMSDIAKQVQHNPGGPKKGSGWLSPLEMVYFKGKVLEYPIIKIRKILTDLGVKKEKLQALLDFPIDEARGATRAAQQYIEDNYSPIFEPLKKMGVKKAGQVARDLSRYLVAKRTRWLYKNIAGYEDAGISLETASVVVGYTENGDNPDGEIITDMAQQLWDYNKGLVKIKYDAGVIDKDLVEKLKEPYYVPHYRDVETGIDKPSAPMKLMFTSTNTGIKRIKGSKSGHMIIDPLQLMISSTNETIINASRVKVAQNIIKIAEEYPDVFDGLVRQFKKPPIKAGNIEHRMQIDKALQDQIDSIAKEYGVSVKTASKLGKKRLGQFDSFSQNIKVLYGATESVRAHELGHLLDQKVKWLNKLLSDKKNKLEMMAIGDSRYEGEEVSLKYTRYVRQQDERNAEFISLYLTDRPMLRHLAPDTTALFEARLSRDNKLRRLKDIKPTNVKTVESFYEANWVADNSIPADEDVISLRKDGKLVHYRVPIEMAQAVKSLHPNQISGWMKWTFVLQAQMLRFGAVGGNIGFAAPNITRDQIQAAFNGKAIPFVDWFIGAKHFIENSEVAKMMLRRGGGIGAFESGMGSAKKGYSDVVYGKALGFFPKQYVDPFYWKNRGVLKATGDLSLYAIKFPFKPVLSLINLSEAASRVGIFRRNLVSSGVDLNNLKAKDAEFAISEAVHAERHNAVDFDRVGYSMQLPNAITPFLNAALEGVDRMSRSVVVPIQEGKVPIRPIMFTTLAYGIYFGLAGWNERFEEYKEIPSREKANNWIIMRPNGSYWKIPKDHATRIVLNPFQMIYETIKGFSSKSGWGLTVDIFTDISPVDPASAIPLTLKLIIEPIVNYDFYWSDTIEKLTVKANIRGHRFKNSTSETLKTIGEALNISPIMMQHEIRSQFGGLGRDILWLTDWVLGTAGVQKPPGLELENAIVIKRFVGKTEEWMSDSAERIRKINKRIAEIKRAGKGARVKRLKSMKYTPEEIRKVIIASRKEMRQLHIRKRKLEIAQHKIRLLKSQANKTGTKFK